MAMFGLVLFVLVFLGDAVALTVDAWLYRTGRTTITSYTRRHPWVEFIILLWQVLGVVGLVLHFAFH